MDKSQMTTELDTLATAPLPIVGTDRDAAALDVPALIGRLEANLTTAIRGKPESIRMLLVALISGGHVLLDDVPGTGKTTLAKALARSIDAEFRRIQFTPDLLPADIIGSTFYRAQQGIFEFREGPVFTNVLLADEINRTSPRTQSALLEVMSENQITIEGRRRTLPQPFFVVATQNPAEYQGTYPLPEAQLDRFAVRITMGYPGLDDEMEILYSHAEGEPADVLEAVATREDILALQRQVRGVAVDRSVADYLLRLVEHTRRDARLRLAISPRGSLALCHAAQALALMNGRGFVLAEDVRELAVPVLAHRIVLDTKARYGGVTGDQVIQGAIQVVPVPR
jgi:MoxR-like ATPase